MALPIIISRLFSAYKEYKQDKKEKEKEKARLKKDESKENSELDSQEKNLKRKKSSQNKRRSRIKSRVSQLKNESQKLEGIINSKKETINALLEEKKSLQDELLNIDEKKQDLATPDKQEQESEDSQTQEPNQDQNQDSDELKDLIDRKREIRRRLSEIDTEISKLESELSSYENNLKEINDSLREEESDLEDIDNSIEDLDSDSENIKSERKSVKDRFSKLSSDLQNNIEKVEKFLDKILLWTILTPIILKLIKRCWLWFKKTYGAKICNQLNTWAENADAPANILLKGLHRLACHIFDISYTITQQDYDESWSLWDEAKGYIYDYHHVNADTQHEEFTSLMEELGTKVESGRISSTNHHYYTEREDLELTTDKLKSSSEYNSIKNSIKSSNPNISDSELDEEVLTDMYWRGLKLDKIYKDVSFIYQRGFLSIVDPKFSPPTSLPAIERAKKEIINNKNSIPFLGYFLRSSKSLNGAYDFGNLSAFKMLYRLLFNRLMREIFGENIKFQIDWEYKIPAESYCKTDIFYLLDGRYDPNWIYSGNSISSCNLEGYQKAILFYLSFPVKDLSTDKGVAEFTAADLNKYDISGRKYREARQEKFNLQLTKWRGKISNEVLDHDYNYLIDHSEVFDETKKQDLAQAYQQLVYNPTTRNVVLATAISKQANDKRNPHNIARGGHEAVLNALKSANIIDKNVYYQSKHGDRNELLIETLKDLEYKLVEGGESNPQVGDIAFIPKSTNTPSQVAIYNGKSWVSDYYQGSLREMADPNAEVKVYRNKKYSAEARRPENLWRISDDDDFEEQFFREAEKNFNQQMTSSGTIPSLELDPTGVSKIDPKKLRLNEYVNEKLSKSKAKKSALLGLNIGDPIHIEVQREPHKVDQENKDNNKVYGKVLINGKEFAESYENRPLDPGNYKVHGSKKGGASSSITAEYSRKDFKPWWYFMKTEINRVFPEEQDGNHIPIVNTKGLNRGGIRIHPSVGHIDDKSSFGCLTIGNRDSKKRKTGFKIEDSKNTWAALMPYLHEAPVATVTYKDPSTTHYNHNNGSLQEPPESTATSITDQVKTTDAGGDLSCSSVPKSRTKHETDKGTNIETDSKSIKGSDSTDKKLDLIIGLVSSTLEQVSIARVESMPTPKTQGPEVTSSYIDNTSQQNTM